MKEVLVVIAPRCCGITTFCNKVISAHPEIALVATENHGPPTDEAYERLQELLDQPGDQRIIFDCWNETREDREQITERLKWFDPQCRTGGWVFTTPKGDCAKWHVEAEMARGLEGEGLARSLIKYKASYDRFHDNRPHGLEGFSFLVQVNAVRPPCFSNIFMPLIDGPYVPL